MPVRNLAILLLVFGCGCGSRTTNALTGAAPVSGNAGASETSSSHVQPDDPGVDLRCQVEGSSTILTLIEEGSVVRQGQLLCELDASWLRDALVDQQIVVKSAEAAILQTKQRREVAELALREFTEGSAKAQEQKLRGLVALAKTELQVAREKLDDARARKDVQLETYEAHLKEKLEVDLKLAQSRSESAESALKGYLTQEEPRIRQELQANVASAKADEQAQASILDLERGKEKKYRDQIAKCKIYAPADGVVIFPQSFPPPGVDPADLPLIEEGASVRQQQLLMRVVPDNDE